jgi:hypothetical protein
MGKRIFVLNEYRQAVFLQCAWLDSKRQYAT